MEENDLKQVFVGKKYQKFERKIFSIPAFFFGGVYFAYRKMILHALLVLIVVGIIDTLAMKLELGLMLITIISIHIAIGLYFPMWYRKFYTKKAQNVLARMDIGREEKTRIMQQKGGTSIGLVIIAIVINTVVSTEVNNFVTKGFLKEPEKTNINVTLSTGDFDGAVNKDASKEKSKEKNDSSSSKDGVLKDPQITGYSSMMGKTIIYLKDDDSFDSEYSCELDNANLLTCISDYEELSVNIYYTKDKEITKFEIYDKEKNLEDIEDIKNEKDLREVLGYPNEGENEEKLKLIEMSDSIASVVESDDTTETYYEYVFETEKGKKLEFRYSTTEKELKKGKTYKAKYEVKKEFFKYQYTITEIKEV